ncbi:hypothetical protein MCUN1_000276 [Malassezia cuniculi]|uniref:Phospholipase/carboxylesterase/thioesterase domain-containing protein n=1 Tax=Malassezia cuniculi TaxID=948313 RepID=A0AAF0J4R9_9BASI|nr:hypothetical protein MCUN1_000276 [Malassezia cuniculi]
MQATPHKEPKTRPTPTSAGLKAHLRRTGRSDDALTFEYAAAPDGVDSNLLIMLHGLGDSSAPFMRLGKTLQRTLPQTAVLSVNAPRRVPLLEEEAWMWWDSFDTLGENPRHAIGALAGLLSYIHELGWPQERIHLFGYAQGGSLALETLVAERRSLAVGSVVSVVGPLLSHPTFSPALSVPLMLITRIPAAVLQTPVVRLPT